MPIHHITSSSSSLISNNNNNNNNAPPQSQSSQSQLSSSSSSSPPIDMDVNLDNDENDDFIHLRETMETSSVFTAGKGEDVEVEEESSLQSSEQITSSSSSSSSSQQQQQQQQQQLTSEGISESLLISSDNDGDNDGDNDDDSSSSSSSSNDDDDNTCLLSADAGPCFDYVLRWFYNSETSLCEQFSYGSCGGNTNNFADRYSCEAKCQSGIIAIKSLLPERCTYDKDEGYGGNYDVKWYFNIRNLRCEQMVYEGKGGNDNQFSSLGDCQSSCIPIHGKLNQANIEWLNKGKVKSSKEINENESLQKIKLPRNSSSFKKFINNNNNKNNNGNNNNMEKQSSSTTFYRTLFHGTSIAKSSEHQDRAIKSQPLEENISSVIDEKSIDEVIDKAATQSSTSSSELSSEDSNTNNYDAVTINKAQQQEIHNQINPPIAPSPPMQINYQSGVRLNKGEPIIVDEVDGDGDDVTPTNGLDHILSAIDEPSSQQQNIPPVCPNGRNVMQYSDGRPVLCLPGKDQCPNKSSCYFNGIDFFCCPNEDDPYDNHVFGGYNGDEERYGYKKSVYNNKNRRIRRDVSLPSAVDLSNHFVRIDAKAPPQQYGRASIKHTKRIGIEPCKEEMDKGGCNEAHLRYFYDRKADECRLFYYSGCNGNSNNFATQHECEQRCKLTSSQSSSQSLLLTPAGMCPYGQLPLGDNAPVLCGNLTDSIQCPYGYYCRYGPPNICCPDLSAVFQSNKSSEEKPFKPLLHSSNTRHSLTKPIQLTQKSALEISNEKSVSSTNGLTMCPDGSDALLDEQSGAAIKCGSGFDGQQLCPIGYYCSINNHNNERLCCPMGVYGSKIPPPPVIAPYLGLRQSNPGEIIERGSLPSDPKPHRLPLHKAIIKTASNSTSRSQSIKINNENAKEYDENTSKRNLLNANDNINNNNNNNHLLVDSNEEITTESSEIINENITSKSSNGSNEKTIEEQQPYGRMMLKPFNNQQHQHTAINKYDEMIKNENDDMDGVQIDIADIEDPFNNEQKQQQQIDKSICYLKPSEGRLCREDEGMPRTNLKYYYSHRDHKCKLYFYGGCGGNANRFDNKQLCESLCMAV